MYTSGQICLFLIKLSSMAIAPVIGNVAWLFIHKSHRIVFQDVYQSRQYILYRNEVICLWPPYVYTLAQIQKLFKSDAFPKSANSWYPLKKFVIDLKFQLTQSHILCSASMTSNCPLLKQNLSSWRRVCCQHKFFLSTTPSLFVRNSCFELCPCISRIYPCRNRLQHWKFHREWIPQTNSRNFWEYINVTSLVWNFIPTSYLTNSLDLI